MGTPAIWLGGALVICIGLFAAGVVGMFNAAQRAKHEAGLATGRGETSVATLEAAREASNAERAAEAAIPLTADRRALIIACNRSASCLERGKYKP
jgi:hypothetical protein